QVVPVGHAVVSHVEAAVAADDHVPAVARVNPQGVLIGVDAAHVAAESLAAVGRAVQADAQHIEVPVIAGVHANLAEIHGPRVHAVDACPRFAAVGGLVDAAVLVAVLALLVLHVFFLAAQPAAPGPPGIGTPSPP